MLKILISSRTPIIRLIRFLVLIFCFTRRRLLAAYQSAKICTDLSLSLLKRVSIDIFSPSPPFPPPAIIDRRGWHIL